MDEVVSFGDTLCDLVMLKEIKLSFCPSNSDKEIKENASYVLPYDNNQDAFYHIVFDYLKI